MYYRCDEWCSFYFSPLVLVFLYLLIDFFSLSFPKYCGLARERLDPDSDLLLWISVFLGFVQNHAIQELGRFVNIDIYSAPPLPPLPPRLLLRLGFVLRRFHRKDIANEDVWFFCVWTLCVLTAIEYLFSSMFYLFSYFYWFLFIFIGLCAWLAYYLHSITVSSHYFSPCYNSFETHHYLFVLSHSSIVPIVLDQEVSRTKQWKYKIRLINIVRDDATRYSSFFFVIVSNSDFKVAYKYWFFLVVFSYSHIHSGVRKKFRYRDSVYRLGNAKNFLFFVNWENFGFFLSFQWK